MEKNRAQRKQPGFSTHLPKTLPPKQSCNDIEPEHLDPIKQKNTSETYTSISSTILDPDMYPWEPPSEEWDSDDPIEELLGSSLARHHKHGTYKKRTHPDLSASLAYAVPSISNPTKAGRGDAILQKGHKTDLHEKNGTWGITNDSWGHRI